MTTFVLSYSLIGMPFDCVFVFCVWSVDHTSKGLCVCTDFVLTLCFISAVFFCNSGFVESTMVGCYGVDMYRPPRNMLVFLPIIPLSIAQNYVR